MKTLHIPFIYPPCLASALIILLFIPAIAEETTIGDFGVGILTLIGPRASSVSLIAPSDISNWALSPIGTGVNTIDGTLQVSADGDWQVSATDSSSTTNGRMTEWDGSQYIATNPKRLASPMSIFVVSGGNVDTGYKKTLPSGGVIAIGPTTNNILKDVKVNTTGVRRVTNSPSFRLGMK